MVTTKCCGKEKKKKALRLVPWDHMYIVSTSRHVDLLKFKAIVW